MDKLHIYIGSFISSLKSTDTLNEGLEKLALFFSSFPLGEVNATITAAVTSFTLIFVAEIGDKSQLVCMTLAARHQPVPVIAGAATAFALLNALAVGFGATIANWLPDYVIAVTVTLLFLLFGIQALRTGAEESDANIKEKSDHGIFFTTFLLITFAELGDKTQLAVVALSSTDDPVGVWIGATLALASTSALGVFAGKRLLQIIPLALLHKIGGLIFLVLALVAAVKAYQGYFGL